jgi:hypothetical protein
MSSSRKASKETREANVLLEFQMVEPMSAEVLDANSEDVMDAVVEHASDIALGPAIALNFPSCAIKLRFDVLAKNDAEIHKKIGTVIATIFRETDLCLEVSRSSVEAHDDAEQADSGHLTTA